MSLRVSKIFFIFQLNSTEYDVCEVKFESPRSSLSQIQNIRKEFSLSNSPVSSVSPPVAYNNNFRFEAYQKVCSTKFYYFYCPFRISFI